LQLNQASTKKSKGLSLIMKVVLVSPDQNELTQLGAQLSTAGGVDLTAVHGNGQEVGPAVERYQPNILVVDGVFQEDSAFEQLERTIAANPGMAVILVAKTLTPEFLLRMMRMGITEVLPQPANGSVIKEAIDRAGQRTMAQRNTRRQGKVLAMMGCKGGSGVTFLAANLGYAYASAQPDQRVILIDLNLQGGDAELFVSDGRAHSSVASIAAEIQRLDGTLLESSLVRVLPNYGVLAAALDTHEAFAVKPEHVSQLIEVAAKNYDLVILDVPRSVDPVTVRALDRASEICVILQMTLPFIRDAKKLLGDFRALGYGPDKLHLVINRFEKEPDITLKDIQNTLGMPIHRTIPNSYKNVANSVNQGIPINKLAPRDPVSRTLMEMASVITQNKSAAQPKGWLSSLTGR
jgi:pilus assembly protein CpaE